jgi:ATP-dependent DNA helicase RecQ
VLEGRSQIVVLPTGAGKSLCFQLPASLLAGPTLVLVPLLSLLSDQLRRLRESGAVVGELRGGMSGVEKRVLFDGMRTGRLPLVLATPEACLTPRNLEALRRCRVAHLVVDEAHCLSEWGESFRPSYLEVGSLARALGAPQVSAFTATASPSVLGRIREILFADAEVTIVEAAADRPTISYHVLPVLSRLQALMDLASVESHPLLVFSRTRAGTEIAARQLTRRRGDSEVRFYHAGLSREERAQVERWYLRSPDGILVATCAYGMGVDKPDIRTVIHTEVPPSVEAYLQETGRASRDGLPSRALLLLGPGEEAFGEGLEDEVARARFERMLGYARTSDRCRRAMLLGLIGQEPVFCAGCDVCDGTVARRAPGEREIIDFVRRQRRRFTISQAAEILTGAPGPRSVRGFHERIRGYAALPTWDSQELEQAMRLLVSAGALAVHSWGPWKGRLTLGEVPPPSA